MPSAALAGRPPSGLLGRSEAATGRMIMMMVGGMGVGLGVVVMMVVVVSAVPMLLLRVIWTPVSLLASIQWDFRNIA